MEVVGGPAVSQSAQSVGGGYRLCEGMCRDGVHLSMPVWGRGLPIGQSMHFK